MTEPLDDAADGPGNERAEPLGAPAHEPVGPSSPEPATSGELQFDRVEPVADEDRTRAVTCVNCGARLSDEYFVVNLKVACDRCRRAIEGVWSTSGGFRTFARAAAYGIGAAAIGSLVYFAVLKLTGYEIGLIAVFVGLLVGGAVRYGARGRGGRRYQVLAMVLTYSAIVSTYMPMVYSALHANADAAAAAAPSGTPSASPTGAPTAAPDPSRVSPPAAGPQEVPGLAKALGMLVVFVAILFFFAAAAPWLAGFSNVMGWIIIGIALYEAWKINKPPPLVVRGPFRVGDSGDGAP